MKLRSLAHPTMRRYQSKGGRAAGRNGGLKRHQHKRKPPSMPHDVRMLALWLAQTETSKHQ
jgi:hypothetical protein